MYDYTQALERSRLSREQVLHPTEVEFLGERWIVLPEVFVPVPTNSTVTHLGLLAFRPGTSFLEIGSGIGVIAVGAARAGCRPVVATDMNPNAVENTARNAERFGVADVVRCVESDLFDALDEGERFDVVYWHSNNVLAPADLDVESVHELAFVDPGYEAHRRFLRDAPRFVAPGGQALLALSSRAERDQLDALAADEGRRLVPVAARTVEEPEGPITYEVVEVAPA